MLLEDDEREAKKLEGYRSLRLVRAVRQEWISCFAAFSHFSSLGSCCIGGKGKKLFLCAAISIQYCTLFN